IHRRYRRSIRQPLVSFAYLLASSYILNRDLHTAMTFLGVASVFFTNISAITIESGSVRYTMRQILSLSVIRSSWQWVPMDGIGLECGRDNFSPRRGRRNK